MATHRFDVDGESPLEVRVAAAADGVGWDVGIDEESFHVDVVGGGAIRLAGGRLERVRAVNAGDHVAVWWRGRTWRLPVVERQARRAGDAGAASAGDEISAPMPGTVLAVKVAVGDRVATDDVIVVMESMKMEMSLPTARDAVVAEVLVAEGDMVELGQPLVRFEPADAGDGDG